MTGDGMLAVFDDPAAAVAAALELQQGMSAIAADCGLAFRMRSGLHAGVSQARDGDYFGTEVNRAARIMTAAHGGQILLSQAVVDQGKGRFRDDVDLLHLGRVRLRDLSRPEDVWQLLHGDLQPAFPALRSLDAIPNNLPQQLTSFIGREKEIAEIKGLLATTRLLTLTGSGGCGKTRLALQVAADGLESSADGVWLVELAALADPGLVPQAVASVLGLREERGAPLTQTLVEHLRSRQAAAGAGQLRAPDRRLRARSPTRCCGMPAGRRPGHEPRSAGDRRRTDVSRAVAVDAGPEARRDAGALVAVRVGAPVHGAGAARSSRDSP